MPTSLPAGPYRTLALANGTAIPYDIIPFDEEGRCVGPQTRRHLVEQGFRGDGPIPAIPDDVKVEAMRRYIEAVVYQMLAENMASEQSARMVAMKAASDNAGKIITELQLIYNKTRQAAITKELSEIVGGAAAV